MSEAGTWVKWGELGTFIFITSRWRCLTDNWTSKSEIQEQDQCYKSKMGLS